MESERRADSDTGTRITCSIASTSVWWQKQHQAVDDDDVDNAGVVDDAEYDDKDTDDIENTSIQKTHLMKRKHIQSK